MHHFTVAAIVFVLVAAISCKKAPTDVEYRNEQVRLLEIYYSATNPIIAEGAMLELEKLAKHYEKAGTKRINFDQTYAAIYSRLYRVHAHFGNTNAAQAYYESAKDRWQKSYARDRQPYTPELLDRQITVGAGHLPDPKWKTVEKGVAH